MESLLPHSTCTVRNHAVFDMIATLRGPLPLTGRKFSHLAVVKNRLTSGQNTHSHPPSNGDAMPRILLKSDPNYLDLFCPFCGEQVLGSEEHGEGFSSECSHTICLGFDDEDAEANIVESDVVFEAHEGAPADRMHIFAFREPA
jgi:hypothetical protein